jgi:hypothetical protein
MAKTGALKLTRLQKIVSQIPQARILRPPGRHARDGPRQSRAVANHSRIEKADAAFSDRVGSPAIRAETRIKPNLIVR